MPDKMSLSNARLRLHNSLSKNIVFDEKFGCVAEEGYSIVDCLKRVCLDVSCGMVIPKSENINDKHKYKQLANCLVEGQ